MRWKLGLTLLLLVLLGGAFGLGWYVSGSILTPQPYGLMPEFEILAVGEGSVTLPEPDSPAQFDDTLAQGRYGLVWEGGSGLLGDVERRGGGEVVRPLALQAGRLPVPGEPARMDTWLYHQNPRDDLGLAYEDVTLQGEVGALHGWWLPAGGGSSDTAVLMLHGRRRGDLPETMRILPTLTEMGYAVLALSYRNHGASAPSPDGFYHYGASEWRDAVTGLEFLARQGARKVVLYGFSLGGAVALEAYEHQSEAAAPTPQVVALVLDSPLIDARAVIERGAENMGLPLADQLADLGLLVARFRAGIDWGSLDQRASAASVRVPVLLIAGSADRTVPVEAVDAFAARLPEVDYRRLEGVEHVEGWNQNPAAYESWVRTFLLENAPVARLEPAG